MFYRIKFVVFVMAVLLSQGLVYSQEFQKNELTISIGASIPTSGDLYTERHIGERQKVFDTEKTGATFRMEYSRFFKESLALRVSYQQASYFASRPNWDWWLVHPSHKIPTYSLDVGLCYYYDLGKIMSLYVGGGINVMTTQTKEDDWFKVNYPSAEAITPLTHIHAGPFVFSGISLKLSDNITAVSSSKCNTLIIE